MIAGKYYPPTSCNTGNMPIMKIRVGGRARALCSVVLKLRNAPKATIFLANNSSQWCCCLSGGATVYSPAWADRHIWTQESVR